MKNLNKLFVGLLMSGCVLSLGALAHATVGVRGPKDIVDVNYTTSATAIAVGPGAVYEILLSTGAAGDYCVLRDSNSTSGLASGSVVASMGPRFYHSSTSANTTIVLDPPLLFVNGLVAIQSAAGNTCSVTYEVGRGLTGQ